MSELCLFLCVGLIYGEHALPPHSYIFIIMFSDMQPVKHYRAFQAFPLRINAHATAQNLMIFNNVLNVLLTKKLQLVCRAPEFSAASASSASDTTDENPMQKRSSDVHEHGH